MNTPPGWKPPAGYQEWRTPLDKFLELHRVHDFNVDAAATPANALVGSHHDHGIQHKGLLVAAAGERCHMCNNIIGRYYTAETDGADPEHYGAGDVVYCNPPYNGITVARFVRCADLSRRRGAKWVLVLNGSCTDTRWFHRHIWDRNLKRPREGVEYDPQPSRWRFLNEYGDPGPAPRYPTMVITMHPLEAAP